MTSVKRTSLEPVTRVQIARYAGAVGDFNLIHVDEEFARKVGLPSIIAHGPLTLTLAIDAIVAQLGASSLRSFDARLRTPVLPGDRLELIPTENGIELQNSSGKIVASVTLKVEGRHGI